MAKKIKSYNEVKEEVIVQNTPTVRRKMKDYIKYQVSVFYNNTTNFIKIKIFRLLFWNKKSNLFNHFDKELKLAGLKDKDSDYGGSLYYTLMDLGAMFSFQRHSGFSASYTSTLFDMLSRFKPITEITNSPDEWTNISEGSRKLYQNKRDSACFSTDLKKYYRVDEKPVKGKFKFYKLNNPDKK